MFDVLFFTQLGDYLLFRGALEAVVTGLGGAGRVIAVVPDAEASLYASLGLPARIVAEGSLDPRLGAAPRSWHKQQTLKLCAHRVMTRDTALVLDSDVFLTRPVRAEDIAPGDRAPFYIDDLGGGEHADGIDQAARLLGLEGRARTSYFPAPNFVDRRALAALHDSLSHRYGGDSTQVLLDKAGELTAWALYGMFVAEVLGAESPHPLAPARHAEGIWGRGDWDAWDPAARRGDAPPFVVIQSRIGLSIAEIRRKAGPLPHLAAALSFSSSSRAWVIPRGAPVEAIPPGHAAADGVRAAARDYVFFEPDLLKRAPGGRLAFRMRGLAGATSQGGRLLVRPEHVERA
jgi:hypothetical protein